MTAAYVSLQTVDVDNMSNNSCEAEEKSTKAFHSSRMSC